MEGRAFAEVEIALEDGGVAGDGVSGVQGDGAEGHRNIAGYVSVNVNGAEGAGDVPYGIAFGDGDVGTEAGAVVAAVRVPGEGGK